MDRNQINLRLFFWYAILWVLLIIALHLAYGVYFVDTMSTKSKWVGVFAGAIALLLASCKTMEISFCKSKNPMFEKITKYFLNGSFIFIKRLFKISLVFVFLISCFLIKPMGNNFIICFVTGSIFSFLTIFLSTITSAKIATRSSQFYNESNLLALKQIYNSGVVISCVTCALMIIPLVILFHNTKDYQVINAFVFGAALISIINNVSTSISKQAVDCANDLACNNLAEFEINDRRNPLLLLSGVTKSVLGVNILSSDLFVSSALALLSAMAVGGAFYQLMGAFLPIIIAASGIFSCVIVVLLTRFRNAQNPLKSMFVSLFFANVLLVAISYFLVNEWLEGLINLVYSIAIGAFSGFILCFSHSNLIYSKYKPSIDISNTAISGFIPTLRQTIKESFGGVFLPVLIMALCFVFSFVSAQGINEPSIGLYGIALSVLSMLSCVGIMIGMCSFGLTTKNVNTILDTYEEDICEKQNIIANTLGEVGFHIVSLCKNFVICASFLTVIVSVIAYSILANLEQIDIVNPYVLTSLLIGATIPFVYSSSILGIVSKTARRLGIEVKRQLKKSPQIMRYEIRPDYEKCCEIAALNSSIQVVFHTMFVVIIFFVIAKYLNIEALAGFIIGIMLSSIGLLFTTSSSSTLAKGAKKYFEEQFNCVKNTEEYNAISLNDAIFNAFRELITPSLSALIKFIAILALVLVPMFM